MKKLLIFFLITSLFSFPLVSEAATPSFPDVPKNHWAFSAIEKMKNERIISGYPDGTFKPKQKIERQHAALLLSRLIDEIETDENITFLDVPSGHPYAKHIQKVASAGIFKGDEKNRFRPNDPLTRAEMAVILTRAFELQVKATYDFPDISETHWAKDAIRALYSNGITSGIDGYYKPDDYVTRAQYAVFLHNALNIDPNFEAKPIPNKRKEVVDMLASKWNYAKIGETSASLNVYNPGTLGGGYEVLFSLNDPNRMNITIKAWPQHSNSITKNIPPSVRDGVKELFPKDGEKVYNVIKSLAETGKYNGRTDVTVHADGYKVNAFFTGNSVKVNITK